MSDAEMKELIAQTEFLSEALWTVFNTKGSEFSEGVVLVAAAKTLAAVILELAEKSEYTLEEVYEDADFEIQRVLRASDPDFPFAYDDFEQEV